MKNTIIYLSLLFSFFVSDLSATHIVAGFSSYTHLNEDSYEITYTLIRDKFSNGSQLDNDIIVQVYTFDGINYIFQSNILVQQDGLYAVDHQEQSDLASQFYIALEYAEYSFEFELSNPVEDYVFVYQRCCRSPSFSNIANPDENGITLITSITKEAQAVKNSSIEFDVFPKFLAIANQAQEFPINATSIDGDTLSYQFAPAYYGGGLAGSNGSGSPTDCDGVAPVGPCYPPYDQVAFSAIEASFFEPFPAWQDQGINPDNGALTGTPSVIGQFGYGFAIHEYRNGQIINTTSFDYIVYVLPLVSHTEEIVHDHLKLIGNPSANSFIIECRIEAQDLNFAVYNMKGEKMQAIIELSENRIKVDFDGPEGMYILKAYNEKINQSLKLVKL